MSEIIENQNVQPVNAPVIERYSAFEKSKAWIRFLLGKWLVILLFVALGLTLGILYAKQKKVKYESYLTFSLDESGSSSGNSISGLFAQFGFGVSENNLFAGDNIVEVIKSRTILERVLLSPDTLNGQAHTMIEYYYKIQPGKQGDNKKGNVVFQIGADDTKFTYSQDSILYNTQLEILKNYLRAGRPDKQLNIYVINFKSPDERFSKIFTDKLLSETIKFYTELKTQKSESTLGVLEQRIGIIKGNLNQSISSRASAQDANVNPAFSAAQVPLQKQQLNVQVYGAAYGELYKNLELARLQYLQNIPLLQIISNNDYPMAKISASWVKLGLIGAFVLGLLGTFFLTVFFMIKRKNQG